MAHPSTVARRRLNEERPVDLPHNEKHPPGVTPAGTSRPTKDRSGQSITNERISNRRRRRVCLWLYPARLFRARFPLWRRACDVLSPRESHAFLRGSEDASWWWSCWCVPQSRAEWLLWWYAAQLRA